MNTNPEKRVRAAARLSDTACRKTRGPAILEDGKGLRLIIDERGNRRWVLRLTIAGKRVNRGLGSYPEISLDCARRLTSDMRQAADEGRDARVKPQMKAKPGKHPPSAEPHVMTFRDALTLYFESSKRPRMIPGKFPRQWMTMMQTHACPHIGERPVADITGRELVEMLQPIWHTKPETARRVLQRMNATFKSAILRGYRSTANPCDGVGEELGRARPAPKHRRAMPWQDAPQFITWLRDRPYATLASKLCLEMIVLTATRSREARWARWSEFNLVTAQWTIPGIDPVETARLGVPVKRMKMGIDHVIPLSTAAMRILEKAKGIRRDDAGNALVFPSSTNTPLSDNTLSKLLRDGGIPGVPHGFRSTFKTWCAEHGVRDEVSEMALAHGDPNKVREAYRRATYLDERKLLMQQWADYLAAGQRP